MINDKRKAPRRPIRYNAWLVIDGKKPQGCMMSDVSTSGARLSVADSKTIPAAFMLLLSGNGTAHRACQVIWRNPKQVGVAFVRGSEVTKLLAQAPKQNAAAAPVEAALAPADDA